MKTWIPDPSNIIRIPGDEEETLAYAAQDFIKVCEEAIQKRGAAYIALSGGSTPKAIFQRLKPTVDGKKVYLFWSDERCVPKDNAESNYHMAMTSGPFKEWVPEDHMFHMENANLYEKKIRELVPDATFDLILLGMGDDGHTASLFPDTKALSETQKLVTDNYVDKLSAQRITFTFPLIHKARKKVVYLIGNKKAEMAKKVLIDRPGIYPAEKIGTHEHPATWILDQGAASLLEESLC